MCDSEEKAILMFHKGKKARNTANCVVINLSMHKINLLFSFYKIKILFIKRKFFKKSVVTVGARYKRCRYFL